MTICFKVSRGETIETHDDCSIVSKSHKTGRAVQSAFRCARSCTGLLVLLPTPQESCLITREDSMAADGYAILSPALVRMYV